jgi:hypothetical protein
MKKARGVEVTLRNLTTTYGIVPERVRAVQVAWAQAVAMYGIELWWDPKEVGRQDDLQLLLNRQARSILDALHTTPWGTLIRESGLSPAPEIIDSRQQRFIAILATACHRKLKELHRNPSPCALVFSVIKEEHEHCRTTKGMMWPAPGQDSVVRTTILDDTTAGKSTAQRWAREQVPKIRAGV